MKTRSRNNKLFKFLGLFTLLASLISCGSRQDVVYFQDVDLVAVSMPIKNYNPLIHPDDILTINVSALDTDLVRPFNLPAVQFVEVDGNLGPRTQQTYLVDVNGNIEFPVLGTLKLAGLNRIQATTMIKDRLKEYIKDPIVNIRTINFKVTVLGEVTKPGLYTIPNERITILEALGMAGDLTIGARRDNVLVVREEDGKKTYNRINLTSEEVFNSSVYYLTQNDLIYIEPNNSRVKSSTVGPNTGATLGVISAILTAVALVVSITRF